MKKSKRMQPKRRGFTLLEVLLVLVILGVIAALVVPQLTGSQEKALILATETAIKQAEAKVEMYALDHLSSYPESLNDLLEPVDMDGEAMRPYVKEIPQDAWKQPFNYELSESEGGVSSMTVRIWSNGPNKKNDNGSGDDIGNWSDTEASR